MDKFEQQFDNIDVTSNYMEQSMSQTTSLTTPEDEVNTLMAEVADEHGLEIQSQLGTVGTGKLGTKVDPLQIQQDELSKRLAALKNSNM
jgi:charged multivesicular body protein 1